MLKVCQKTTTCDVDATLLSTFTLVDIFRVLSLVVIACCVVHIWFGKHSKPIPGPWSLPLVGSLPFLGLRIHKTFDEMRKKYGDVFQIQIGSKHIIILNGLKTVRTALSNMSPTFDGRPNLFTFGLASAGKSMVFNSYSMKWKIHRKLAEHALKLSTQDSSCFMTNVVSKEADDFVERCVDSCKDNEPVDPENAVLWSIAQINYTLCYGNSHTDADFTQMIKNTLELIKSHNRGNAVNFFPWAKYVFRKIFWETTKVCSNMLSLTEKKEREHLGSYKDGVIRDSMDALIYLGMKQERELEPERVMHTVQEYIAAGLDIVYAALHWMLLYLANFPEEQDKVRQEIDRVIGHNRKPEMNDLHRMPYSHSFVLEVLRHTSVVPFCLPHSTLQETSLNGFVIPKDAFILVNLHSLHHDENVWPEPDKFTPERFLTGAGDMCAQKMASFHPFGIGRRQCVGEKLGMSELFLYLTTLVQGAHVLKPSEVTYDLEPKFGVILRPKQFQLVFKRRQSLTE